jgi:hypothetical protein
LFGIAYRMLGEVGEAEDAVQEAFLRWTQADQKAIENPAAWLTTVVTRLCLDRLRSAQRQRETYVGPWLPEPLLADDVDPADIAGTTDTLTFAFLVVLERLSPAERAVAEAFSAAALGGDLERLMEVLAPRDVRGRRWRHGSRGAQAASRCPPGCDGNPGVHQDQHRRPRPAPRRDQRHARIRRLVRRQGRQCVDPCTSPTTTSSRSMWCAIPPSSAPWVINTRNPRSAPRWSSSVLGLCPA